MAGNIIQWKELCKRRRIWLCCVTLSRLLGVSGFSFCFCQVRKIIQASDLFFFCPQILVCSSLFESRERQFEDQSCAQRTAQGRNGNSRVLADVVGLLN